MKTKKVEYSLDNELPTKKVGYIVKYSAGSWEDYREYTVGVYMDKKAAEKRRKEIDNNFQSPPKPEWDEEDWEAINDVYFEEFENPTIISKKYPSVKENKTWKDFDSNKEFDIYLRKKHKEQNMLLEDIVMMSFPSWTREKAREQIDIQENFEQIQTMEYGGAYIEEIDVFD